MLLRVPSLGRKPFGRQASGQHSQDLYSWSTCLFLYKSTKRQSIKWCSTKRRGTGCFSQQSSLTKSIISSVWPLR